MSGFRIALRARVGALSLDVELRGGVEPVALLGPSGSGKTTLLRLVAGALTPDAGEIEVGGHLLYSSDAGVDLPPEARGVGYVPQGYGLFPHLDVLDNVAFGLSTGAGRQPRAQRREAARRALAALDCEALAARMPQRLSGGEQQRVALARALLTSPRMLLLDEPLSALDAGVRRRVRGLLAERLRELGRPSIVVAHDVRDVAALGATLCVLEGGRIVQRGSLSALRAAPASERVAELVEDAAAPAADPA